MPHTTESTLDHPAIEGARQFVSEFKFNLKEIATEVTIRLYRPTFGKGIVFEQSHFIKTPRQGTPYQTSRPWNTDEATALHQVVNGFTSHYDDAVSVGLEPSEEWLVRNEHFG